jgi:hypothetical protein
MQMTAPVDESTNIGYCVVADVYCSFSEYYGDGTVYGWRHLYVGADVLRGAGKSKKEIIELGAVQEEAICPAVPADLIVLTLESQLPPPAELVAIEPVAVEPVVDSSASTQAIVTVTLGDVKVVCSSKSSKEIKVIVDEQARYVEFVI